jgi:myo-inositol-1-phosphate synthase
MNEKKIGVWLVGALGSISITVMLGALSLRKGLCDTTGMVTATEHFSELGLVPFDALEFGGSDVRRGSLREIASSLAREGVGIDSRLVDNAGDDLDLIETNIRQGTTVNCGEAIERISSGPAACEGTIREEIARLAADLEEFKKAKNLSEVVVVNLASTEPLLELGEEHSHLQSFEDCLDSDRRESVRAATLYAYAAIQTGSPYMNFTPSNSALFPAMVELAERKGVPVMGNDGKTGETLVKSVLAPMFVYRNMEVLSWEGFNILGNMDGLILNHPENKESKVKTKDAVLGKILGYQPHSQVHINYVPSLSDQKTAWDFVHFKGFLGAKMSLQFVWQGYDSLLAAPLVLDLVRMAELAKRRGEAGLMPHLASYFKNPLGVAEHRLNEQFGMLMDYAGRAKQPSSAPSVQA